MKRTLRRLLLVVLLPIAYFYGLSFMAARPADLGVTNGRLKPCPNSPNCVCTQAEDDAHRIAPLPFRESAEESLRRLKAVIAAQPRMRIVTETENYLHVEAISLLFRFVDDVEFLLDESAGVVQFRSASRVGYADLGANRARMERIREVWDR